MTRLAACPVTRDEVNAFVRDHHRHHGPVVGYRFGAGVELDGRLVGFRLCFTAILGSETGASLRAAGWVLSHTTRGGAWDRPSRSRQLRLGLEGPKQIWVAPWCQGGAR